MMLTRAPVPAGILTCRRSLLPVVANFGIQIGETMRLGHGYVRYELSARPADEHGMIRAVLDTGIQHCALCDSPDGRHWLTVPRSEKP